MTLQAAKTKCLRQITIFIALGTFDTDEEVDHRERQDLDHLLVKLWTSRSVIPKIKCVGKKSMDLVPSFFPELVSREVVCEMGYYDKFV